MLPKLLSPIFERARVRLGLEIHVVDAALTPMCTEPEADLRAALAYDSQLRDALAAAVAAPQPVSIQMLGRAFEAVPVRLAGAGRGLALIGVSPENVQRHRAFLEFWVEIVKAVSDSTSASPDSMDDSMDAQSARTRRLAAALRFLRHIVETGSEADVAQTMAHMEMWSDMERLVETPRGKGVREDERPTKIRRNNLVALSRTRQRRRAVADDLYNKLVHGRESFWTAVYPLYMQRKITRDNVRDLVRKGLEDARGNYKIVAKLFNMEPGDYKRFLNFLRQHDCRLPFKEYRH
jgi:hypothetical protein